MTAPLKLNVGRERVTSTAHPSETGYIRSIRKQMKAIQENMLRVVNHVDNVTPEAIKYALKPIFDESQRLVPVDEGDLKRSGFVEVRKLPSGATAAIGYGRYGKPHYAAFVHERTDIRHRAPTQAKFLETAVTTKLDTFRRRLELFYRQTTGISTGAESGGSVL